MEIDLPVASQFGSVAAGLSKADVRQLLEALPHMTWILGLDLEFIYCNPRFTEFTGHSQETLLRIGWQPLVHPDDLSATEWTLAGAIERSEPFEVECRLRHVSGEYRRIIGRGVPLKDETGAIAEWMGTTIDIHDRWLSEEKLRRSEELLKSVLNSAIDGIISIDEQGVIQTFNESAEAMFGYPVGKISGQTLNVLLRIPDHTEHDSGLATFGCTNLPLMVGIGQDVIGRRQDGSTFLMEMAVAECDVVGERRYVISVRDVTEKKQAEEARRAGEQQLQLALDAGKMGMWVWDVVTNECRWNRTEFELLGLVPTEEFVNPDLFFQHVLPDDLENFKQVVTDALYHDTEFITEFRVVRTDGAIRWLAGRGQVIRDPATWQPLQMMGVNYDITDRKLAHDILEASQRRLRLAMDASRLGVWEVIWPQGSLMWDEAYGTQFGRSPEHYPVTEDAFYECVYPEDRSPVKAAFRRSVLQGVDFESEFRIVRLNGEIRWHAAFGRTTLDAQGRPTMTIGVGRDITDRKGLQEELRQSQKMEAVGQLAGGVAHDFNNILTVINGYAEILDSELPPHDRLRGYLEKIQHAGEKAASLTRQLLAFSRKQVLQLKPVDLSRFVSESHEMLRRLIGAHLQLVVERDPDMTVVKADPTQITQLLLNLCVNARDAMPAGGRLTIQTSQVELDESHVRARSGWKPGPYVVLVVSDTGCGMTPEVQDRIFEPFYTTKETGKGTGLGLSVVHGIVKQSGGYIEVDSEPGQGTTFTIYLPQIDETPAAESQSPESPAVPRASETILLVEDERAVQGLSQLVLETEGYTVLTANNGQEALHLADQHPGRIDLLVTDVVMPGVSGPQLAGLLRHRRPELKTLFMSGYTQDSVLPTELGDCRTTFLEKPFSRRSLSEKVREILDRTVAAVAD